MFIEDVSLNDMKILTKGEQIFFYEDEKNVELYAFKAGPFMLRTVIAKPENLGERISLISHLPENKVKLRSRVIITESLNKIAEKINRIDIKLEEMNHGRGFSNL